MRKSNLCILIVYSKFGDGHLQAAKAIRQSLASKGVDNVHMVDLWDEAHPQWNAISRFGYLTSNMYFPRMYGASYHLTNQTKPNPPLSRFFHSMGKRKMEEIVRQLKPDAVIHTFPYLAMLELNGVPNSTSLHLRYSRITFFTAGGSIPTRPVILWLPNG